LNPDDTATIYFILLANMRFPGGDPSAERSRYMKVLKRFEDESLNMDFHRDRMTLDYLFTYEWTRISTADGAFAFVEKLWKMMTHTERKYVYNLYHGRHTLPESIAILEERAERLRNILDGTFLERDEDLDKYRTGLKPDIDKSMELDESVERLEYYKRELDSIDAAIVTEKARTMDPASISVRPVSVMAAGAADGVDDPFDYRFYKLHALADAMHDFRKEDPKVDIKHIANAIGAELPQRPRRLSPGEDPHAMYGNEEAFIKLFDVNRTLTFGSKSLSHHLHGRRLLDQFSVSLSMNRNLEYWKAYREQFLEQRPSPEIIHADVWSLPQFSDDPEMQEIMVPVDPDSVDDDQPHKIVETKNPKAVVYLSQITNVVTSIKNIFGKEALTFIMDKSDDPMSRMVMATSNIDFAIARLFIVYGGIDNVYADIDDFNDIREELDGSESRIETGESVAREKWSYKVCDANLVDGNLHIRPPDKYKVYPNPDVSEDETGFVFRSDDKVQIFLGGIEGDPLDYGRFKPRALVKIDDRPSKYHGDASREFNVGYMKKLIEEAIATAPYADISTFLSRKRACDWGQVEHCRRYKYIFVSTDRLACFYAMYRNVDFILIKNPKKAISHNANHKPHFVPKIFQTTFTMVRALTDEEIAEKMSTTQEGGARNVLNAVLASIVLVSAFIGSALGAY
jgi:hypothetical protein